MQSSMRALPLVLLVALTAAAPAAAQDASVFGYFRSICGPDLDPARTAARATQQGFAPARKKPKTNGLDEAQGFEKTVAGRELFVIVGRGKGKAKDGLPASTSVACGVGVKGKDEAALAAGRKWVAVPVSRSLMGVSVYGFRGGRGARAPIDFDDKEVAKAALMAGDFNMLTTGSIAGVTVLMWTRSRAS